MKGLDTPKKTGLLRTMISYRALPQYTRRRYICRILKRHTETQHIELKPPALRNCTTRTFPFKPADFTRTASLPPQPLQISAPPNTMTA